MGGFGVRPVDSIPLATRHLIKSEFNALAPAQTINAPPDISISPSPHSNVPAGADLCG
jgi:hypothetical protein